jgi:hypothetical protein
MRSSACSLPHPGLPGRRAGEGPLRVARLVDEGEAPRGVWTTWAAGPRSSSKLGQLARHGPRRSDDQAEWKGSGTRSEPCAPSAEPPRSARPDRVGRAYSSPRLLPARPRETRRIRRTHSGPSPRSRRPNPAIAVPIPTAGHIDRSGSASRRASSLGAPRRPRAKSSSWMMTRNTPARPITSPVTTSAQANRRMQRKACREMEASKRSPQPKRNTTRPAERAPSGELPRAPSGDPPS